MGADPTKPFEFSSPEESAAASKRAREAQWASYPFTGPPDDPSRPHNTTPDFAPGTEVHRKILAAPLFNSPPGRPAVLDSQTFSDDPSQSIQPARYPFWLQRDPASRGITEPTQTLGIASASTYSGDFGDNKGLPPSARRTRGPSGASSKKLADAPGKQVEVLDPRPAKPKRDFVIPTNGPRLVKVNEWRDRLLQASFRGIPFEVETYSMTVGRRTAIYEYPQRDLPSIQDFGLVTKELAFGAYVLGDDYDLQRNNLIQALEFPAPGELVHPYYGRIQCNVTSAKVSETSTEYRIAKFELTFVAVDVVPTTPIVAVNTIMQTDAAKTKALAAYTAKKDSWDDQMGSLGKQFHAAYDQFKVDAKAALEGYFAAEAAIAAAASTSLDFTLADTLQSFLGPVMSLQAFVTWVTEGGPFKDLFTDDRQAEAIAAFDNWIDATVITECVDLLLQSDWDSYEELHRASGEVVNAIRTLEADTDDPEAYDAMVALRISIFQTVWDIGRLLPHERTVEFVGFVPAIVLSYSLYDTPLRDEEIVARNSVVHPSFVVAPVQVLSA